MATETKSKFEELLTEKGFNQEQIEKIYEVLEDDSICPQCRGAVNGRGFCSNCHIDGRW